MKKLIPVLIVIVVLAVAGAVVVASKKKSDTNTTSTTATATMPAAPQPSQQPASGSRTTGANEIAIVSMNFSPASISVKKGTTVTWVNQDSVAHNVTETDGQDGPKSGNLGKGDTYSFTYNTAGTFKYECSIHPNMTGVVRVTE